MFFHVQLMPRLLSQPVFPYSRRAAEDEKIFTGQLLKCSPTTRKEQALRRFAVQATPAPLSRRRRGGAAKAGRARLCRAERALCRDPKDRRRPLQPAFPAGRFCAGRYASGTTNRFPGSPKNDPRAAPAQHRLFLIVIAARIRYA